jgi:DNA-binding CsgD family transcriptional regulator
MVRTTVDRLGVKTLEQRFRYELETGFELAPRIAQGILDVAKGIFSLDGASASRSSPQRLGQIRQVIASAEAPHGKPLCQTDMVDVVWTLDAGEEDLQVLKKYGRVALRQARLLRLIDEALEQGGVPTQEDLARVLGVSVRTIRSDIAALKKQGYHIVTRGQLQGAGRGQTHKVLIVELYLKRYTYSEIMGRTYHSARAIKRYLHTFGQVVMLTRKGLNSSEIAYAVGISERLAQEYLVLYRRCNTPAYQTRLDEIVQMISGGVQAVSRSKKGDQ